MEVILSWLVANWTSIIIPTFTGIVAYLGARKKNKLDLKSQDLGNVAQEFQIYKTVLQDTTEGFKQVIASRNEELILLREQNIDLKKLVSELSQKVDRLTREVRRFERESKHTNRDD